MPKKKRKPGALYFTDVTRAGRNRVALIGNYYTLEGSSEERIALLSLADGNWGGVDLSGIGHAIRHDEQDGEWRYLILERNRGIYQVRPPDDISFRKFGKSRSGFLMDLRRVGESWYAVGGHHQIYRCRGESWRAFDQGVHIPGAKGEAKILTSIDGTSESDMYAVGLNGVIYHHDGTSWSQKKSPTKLGFQCVLCVSSEEVYLCGHGGVHRRSGTQWKSLAKPAKSAYWDMTCFQDTVYVCSSNKLFSVVDDRLVEIKIPVKGPVRFYRMDADENELWTCGNECLLQFDGKRWKQHVFPDNRN